METTNVSGANKGTSMGGGPAMPKTSSGQRKPLGNVPHEGDEALSPREIDAIRSLRVLEERAVNLRKKAQLSDETLLALDSKLRNEVSLVTKELSDVRRRLADLEEGFRTVHDEMRHAARIHEVRALEKYLAYWEPLQFVTQSELARRENLLKERASRPPIQTPARMQEKQ